MLQTSFRCVIMLFDISTCFFNYSSADWNTWKEWYAGRSIHNNVWTSLIDWQSRGCTSLEAEAHSFGTGRNHSLHLCLPRRQQWNRCDRGALGRGRALRTSTAHYWRNQCATAFKRQWCVSGIGSARQCGGQILQPYSADATLEGQLSLPR